MSKIVQGIVWLCQFGRVAALKQCRLMNGNDIQEKNMRKVLSGLVFSTHLFALIEWQKTMMNVSEDDRR